MRQFGCEYHPIRSFLDNGNAGCFAAWIELEPVVMNLPANTIFQDDGERVSAKDGCPTFVQQLARPGRVARVERLAIGIKYENQKDSFACHQAIRLRG